MVAIFFTISLFFDTKVFFFSDLTLAYAMYHIVQRSGLDLFFFKLVLLFYLTSSIIQNLRQKNAVSRNCL